MGKDATPYAEPVKRLEPVEALRVLDLLRRLEDRTFLEPDGERVAGLVFRWRHQVRRGTIRCADVPVMAAELARWGVS